MLDPIHIRRFYLNGFQETEVLKGWPGLWRKSFRARFEGRQFLKLNRFRPRLGFRSLKRLCIHLAPLHLYMSVLDWLMPERVGEKEKANHAYPIGGEYVIDIDSYLFWRPHYHHIDRDGVCVGCLRVSKEATLRLLEKIDENYSDLHVVFSGKRGFHIHVLDFEVGDWTHYNEKDPIKSHEVARFIYTKHLKAVCGGFDKYHFILSSDPMRVVTFPGSLNASTGLICTHLGNRKEFENTPISDILSKSRALKHFYNLDFEAMHYAHPEPMGGDDL